MTKNTKLWEGNYTEVKSVRWITEDLERRGFDRSVLDGTNPQSDDGKCLSFVNKFLKKAAANANIEMKRGELFLKMRQGVTDAEVEAVKREVEGKENPEDKAAHEWTNLSVDNVESALKHLQSARNV